MRPLPLAIVALALVALAPLVGAQAASISLDPAEGARARPGDSFRVIVTVEGADDRTLAMELRAQVANAPGVTVTFDPPRVKAPAGGAATSIATIHVARDARPGDTIILFGAHEPDSTAATDSRPVTTRFALRIIAPPLPPRVDASAAPTTAEPESGIPTSVLIVGGMAAVGAASVTAWGTRNRWITLLAPLYARLTRSEVLEHPLRERLTDLVKAEPGITLGEAQRRLGIGAGAMTHHTRALVNAGVLFSSPDGQHRRLFHVAHGRVAPIPPLSQRAVDTLRQHGPTTLGVLAQRLGVSRQSLHYHVKRLTGEGRLRARHEGAELVLEAA